MVSDEDNDVNVVDSKSRRNKNVLSANKFQNRVRKNRSPKYPTANEDAEDSTGLYHNNVLNIATYNTSYTD